MATDLKSRTEDVTLTRFYGGEERGTCVQITAMQHSGNHRGIFKHVNLTREQARTVAQDLMDFAEGKEIEFFG